MMLEVQRSEIALRGLYYSAVFLFRDGSFPAVLGL